MKKQRILVPFLQRSISNGAREENGSDSLKNAKPYEDIPAVPGEKTTFSFMAGARA